MDSIIILALPGNEELAAKLATQLRCQTGRVNVSRFPDGETLVNIDAMVGGKDVFIIASLDHPDEKFFALYFLAKTLREFGAYSVRLVAPYLPYMQQYKRFQPGDCVSSDLFGHLLSSFIDELITVEPYLHGRSLSDMYYVPAKVLHMGSLISEWVKSHVPDAVLVGLDEKNEQWIAGIADKASKPYVILNKSKNKESGNSNAVYDVPRWKDRTPVLANGSISTAETMCDAINDLRFVGYGDPVCIGVHAIFPGDAFRKIADTGAIIITCNTIPHVTNALDVASLIASAIQKSVYQCLV